jgi:hypothetical protein
MLIVMQRALSFLSIMIIAVAAAAAECKTPWFPSKAGAALGYRQVTSVLDAEGKARASRTTDIQQESFTRKGGELRFTQSVAGPGQPVASEPRLFRCSAAGLRPADVTSKATSTNFEGVQYGADLKPGKKWTMTWSSAGEGGWSLTAKYDYIVAAKEAVTVTAGTFEALRVDYTGVVTSPQRGVLPPIKGSLWVVSGVGIVKQEETDPALALMPQKTTLELMARR